MNRKPKVVYHYCTLEAFESIIKNKCLWLSDIKACNDFKEIFYTWDIFEEYLGTLIDESVIIHYYKHLQEYKENIYEVGEVHERITKENLTIKSNNLMEKHFSSFSTKGNDLSNWVSYGDNGEGVAIGFRTDAFPNNTYNGSKLGAIENIIDAIHFEKVKYSFYNQAKILESAFPTNTLMSYNDFRTNIQQFEPIFKANSFAHEDEWRLIYDPYLTIKNMDKLRYREKAEAEKALYKNDKKNKKITVSGKHYRNTKYGLVSYYEYPIYENSIECIILGPKNKSDNDTVCHFVTDNGFSHYKITEEDYLDDMFTSVYQSTISYR